MIDIYDSILTSLVARRDELDRNYDVIMDEVEPAVKEAGLPRFMINHFKSEFQAEHETMRREIQDRIDERLLQLRTK